MGSALDLTSKENRGLGKGNYSLTQFLEMKVLEWAEDEDMELEYSPFSGYMKVYPEGFNTASEAKKAFTEIYREYKGVYYDE